MSSIRCWQVDAFTDQPFKGNAAAVCLLDRAASADWMQAVAAEMNLSETAFVRPVDDRYELRWFTPQVEVDLCGHATLAASHSLWSANLVGADTPIEFTTKSGVLTCIQRDGWTEMNFPALPAAKKPPHAGLLEALGIERPRFTGMTKFDTLVELESPDAVRTLQPDFRALAEVPTRGVIVTARSEEPSFDFVSRFFAPRVGIDEDPVTGSAHCCLAPYWSDQLGKQAMLAHQASKRGGVLRLTLQDNRVLIGGQACTIWQGELLTPQD